MIMLATGCFRSQEPAWAWKRLRSGIAGRMEDWYASPSFLSCNCLRSLSLSILSSCPRSSGIMHTCIILATTSPRETKCSTLLMITSGRYPQHVARRCRRCRGLRSLEKLETSLRRIRSTDSRRPRAPTRCAHRTRRQRRLALTS